MPIKAVIFDMDGVLVDSEVYWLRSRQEFARDLGKTWTDADQRLAMGRSTIEWAHVMQERLSLTMSLDEIMTDIKRRVIGHLEERLPLRPGAIEAVQLAARHFRVGLASGSPTEIIQQVTRLSGLDQIFEVMVYGDDIPNGKPAPDIYLKACIDLNVIPSNAVGIEDSGNGIRSLHAAGMYVIGAPTPEFPLLDEIAKLTHRIIYSLEDFSLDLIRSLEQSDAL